MSILGVPARLGKGQGAKEIGHDLTRERPKIGHSLKADHPLFDWLINCVILNHF